MTKKRRECQRDSNDKNSTRNKVFDKA